MAEETFAKTTFTIDGQTIPCLTSFSIAKSISEADVSCSDDTVGAEGEEIIKQKFIPTAVGTTASIEGIVHRDVASYDTFETAASTGKIFVLNRTTRSGKSTNYTGYFTDFNESGSLTEVWTFSGTFRVNDEAAVS